MFGGLAEIQTLWSTLYAANAGIVSRSWPILEKMMTVIVGACAAFGLAVPEIKTEGMSTAEGRGEGGIWCFCGRTGCTNGRITLCSSEVHHQHPVLIVKIARRVQQV